MKKTIRNLLFLLFIFSFSIQMNVTETSAKGAEVDQAYEEAVKEGYHTFKYSVPSVSTSSAFWIYDGNNPDNKMTVSPDQEIKVPNSWFLAGEIVVESGQTITATGAGNSLRVMDDLASGKKSDFTIAVTGSGDTAFLTYRLEDFELKENLSLSGWQSTFFNFAEYRPNGGTWTDPNGTHHPGCDLGCNKGEYYRIHIAPTQSVYQPSDPVREGYTFLGWSGRSTLTAENNKKEDHYTWKNPYPFEEKDPNISLGYARGKNVVLTASWAKNPVLEVEDKEISVGDAFDPKEMVKKTDGEVKIELPQDYDKDKEGTYTITFTVTNKEGIKITKTAVLTVKSKSPTKPENPTEPEDPVKPEDSSKPEDPIKPEDPVKPEDPNKPEDPVKPEDSSKPVDSDKHEDPTKLPAPKKQEESKNTSPKTGDAMIASYAVLSLVSLGGLAAVSKKKED